MGSGRRWVRGRSLTQEEYVALFFCLPSFDIDSTCNDAVALTPQAPGEPSGSWDSIHVFEAAERGRQAHYKLTSTIMLQIVDRSASTRVSKEDSTIAKGGRFGSTEKPEQDNVKRDGEVTLARLEVDAEGPGVAELTAEDAPPLKVEVEPFMDGWL